MTSDKDIAEKLQKEILAYKKSIKANYYMMIAAAKKFIERQYYMDLGYDTPEEWIEKVLGFGIRRLQQLSKIDQKFIECKVSEDDKTEIDWTKARLIERVMTLQNAGELIEKAKILTVSELENEVKKYNNGMKVDTHNPKGYIRIAYYDDNEHKTIMDAFELAAKTTGSNSKTEQLIAMCQEYIGTYGNRCGFEDDDIRKEIFERDNWRCRVPLCGKRKNLEPHEVIFRSHGGSMSLENSIVLCHPHHRQVTDGKIIIERTGNNEYKFIKKNLDKKEG